jgi:hypothetical protein
MSAFLLLGPWTPLLFQGQEWGSRVPFRYFADHAPDLQALVDAGRRKFVGQFARAAGEAPSSPESLSEGGVRRVRAGGGDSCRMPAALADVPGPADAAARRPHPWRSRPPAFRA